MSLKLENITKKVDGEYHIYPTNLELDPGLTVLIGQTLAGKTSLMRLMAGLDKPSTGKLSMDGVDITGLPVQKRNIAMVYQQFINYPSLTVFDNIASPLKIANIDRKEVDRRVREVAEMMHIDIFLDKLPAELSGGQQQRTAMARALVKDADLILFDEPLVNLDYKLREELRVEMRDIFKHRRVTAVYSTTEPLEALMLGGRCAVMDAGYVVQEGPTVEVFHNPATVRVGEVFSDPPINAIEGVVADGEIQMAGGAIRFPQDGGLSDLKPGSYKFGIRALDLSVSRVRSDDVEIQAKVELSEVSGSETFIHVNHHGNAWVVQEEGVRSFHIDSDASVFMNTRHVFAFDQKGRLVSSPERGLAN